MAADPKHEQIIQEQTAAELTRMLENVAVQGGNAERIQVPGYRVTSKTGTAQVSDGNGGYKAGVYYTSMVGFAPVDDPPAPQKWSVRVSVTIHRPRSRAAALRQAPRPS